MYKIATYIINHINISNQECFRFARNDFMYIFFLNAFLILHIDNAIITGFYYHFCRKRLEREIAVKHFQEQNGNTYS